MRIEWPANCGRQRLKRIKSRKNQLAERIVAAGRSAELDDRPWSVAGLDAEFPQLPGHLTISEHLRPTRRDDPLDSTTHSGAQDEVAIWLDRVFTDEEALALYEAAISDTVTPADSRVSERRKGPTAVVCSISEPSVTPKCSSIASGVKIRCQ